MDEDFFGFYKSVDKIIASNVFPLEIKIINHTDIHYEGLWVVTPTDERPINWLVNFKLYLQKTTTVHQTKKPIR